MPAFEETQALLAADHIGRIARHIVDGKVTHAIASRPADNVNVWVSLSGQHAESIEGTLLPVGSIIPPQIVS